MGSELRVQGHRKIPLTGPSKRGRPVVRIKAEPPRDWRTLLGTAHWVDDEDVVGPTPERIKAEERHDPYRELEGSVRWRSENDVVGPDSEPWPGELDDHDLPRQRVNL
jgi:hypothetical protein